MKSSLARRSFENTRAAVFVSGRGSNLQALLNQPEDFRISLVISNRKKAPAILKARRAGIPVFIFDSQMAWKQLSEKLKQQRITLIFLLGFMKILPEEFCKEWQGRLLNVHPSLLPLHPGLEAFEKSHALGNPRGVSVHEVIFKMDAGPVLFQQKIPLRPGSQKEKLETERIALSFTEHRLVRESGRRCW